MTEPDALWSAAVVAPQSAAAAIEAALAEAAGDDLVAVSTFETAGKSAEFGSTEGAAGLRRIEGLLSRPPDRAALLAAIARAVPSLTAVEIARVPDADWVSLSQRSRPPVRAGRFLLYGGHNREAAKQGGLAIRIDAGRAFGTGHHETTFGCLIALDSLLKRTANAGRLKTILDLGCGSGVLAIAAALATRTHILATDIDPIAVATTVENAAVNGVGRRSGGAGRVTAIACAGLDHPLIRGRGAYDLVIANILAEPLRVLAPSIGRAVRTGGRAILSGLLIPQEKGIVAAHRLAGFKLERRIARNGWSTLVLVKHR